MNPVNPSFFQSIKPLILAAQAPTLYGLEKRKLGIGSFLGLFYMANIWKAYQVSKIEKNANGGQKEPLLNVLAGIFFPRYYSAFHINKYVPAEKRNSVAHILGQVITPGFYSSFQLAKLREKTLPPTASNPAFEKALAILFQIPYSAYAATTLANQSQKTPAQPLALPQLSPMTMLQTPKALPVRNVSGTVSPQYPTVQYVPSPIRSF